MYVKRCLKHIRNIICLAVVAVALFCVMILYRDYSAQLPLKMGLFVIAFQWVLFFATVFRVRVKIHVKKRKKQSSYTTDFVIAVKKHSIFPYKKMEFTLKYKNQYSDEFITEKYKVDLKERSNIKEYIRLRDLKCGIYEVRIEDMIMYDMFGIASMPLRKKCYTKNFEFIVMPAVYDIKMEIDKLKTMTEEEAADYFMESDELSDYAIREFRDGDKLNKIHWKLTSKKDEIMVIHEDVNSEPFVYISYDIRNRQNIRIRLRGAFIGFRSCYEKHRNY